MTHNADCSPFQILISAQLDGETSRAEDASLQTHTQECAECMALLTQLSVQHRRLRVHTVETTPDMAMAVLAKAHPPRLGRRGWIRQALVTVGITELVLSLPALLLGEDANAPVHIARHVGSLGVALGIALVYAAWRPTRAYGMMPFVAALGLCIVVSSVLDIATGRVAALSESTHLVELGGMFLVWLLAGSPRPRIPYFFFPSATHRVKP